jgi:guanyl-specific ribonuclease Sa
MRMLTNIGSSTANSWIAGATQLAADPSGGTLLRHAASGLLTRASATVLDYHNRLASDDPYTSFEAAGEIVALSSIVVGGISAVRGASGMAGAVSSPSLEAAGATTPDFLAGATVTSRGNVVAQGTVDLRSTLDAIKLGKSGPIFENREGLLPPRDPAYYHEYDVPTPGVAGRGSQRVVVGAGGETYYTADHYESFFLIGRVR